MKAKHLFATLFLTGSIAATAYFWEDLQRLAGESYSAESTHAPVPPQNIPSSYTSTWEKVEQKGRALQEELILFAAEHAQEITNGQYDQQLQSLSTRLPTFFTSSLWERYGALGAKIEYFTNSAKDEICRPEVNRVLSDLEMVIGAYAKQ